MKLLYLGYAVGISEVKNMSGISIAGNKMQLNLIWNLKDKVDELEVLTISPISVFPRDKKLYVKKRIANLGKETYSTVISFFNFPILKQVSQIISVYLTAAKYIKKNRDAIILTYNMFPQVGIPARWLKRIYGNKVVAYLADLPIDDNYQRKGFSKILRAIFDKQTIKSILKVDKVIVLNEEAGVRFAPNIPRLVIDGGINLDDYCEEVFGKKTSVFKNIVYSGSLTEYSGVKELIQSMDMVSDSNIVLEIYGDGVLKNYIESKVSNNIRYYGKISNEEIIKVQKSAWLLVNPRPVDDIIAQVTFPSKIFEYMMSGTPVLATKLNGFSEEYENKIFFAQSNEPEELANCINYINSKSNSELEKKAIEARAFLVNTRTWECQVEKMVEFIKL